MNYNYYNAQTMFMLLFKHIIALDYPVRKTCFSGFVHFIFGFSCPNFVLYYFILLYANSQYYFVQTDIL